MLSLDVIDTKKSGIFFLVYENSKNPANDTLALVKKLKGFKGIYVSLNKATQTLDKTFRIDNKLDNILCYITPFNLAGDEPGYNVIGIESVESLSEILFGIIEVKKNTPITKWVIIDSFDAILTGNKPEIAISFFYQLNQIIKELSYLNFVIVVDEKMFDDQLRDLLSFTDYEIAIGG